MQFVPLVNLSFPDLSRGFTQGVSLSNSIFVYALFRIYDQPYTGLLPSVYASISRCLRIFLARQIGKCYLCHWQTYKKICFVYANYVATQKNYILYRDFFFVALYSCFVIAYSCNYFIQRRYVDLKMRRQRSLRRQIVFYLWIKSFA